MDIRELARSLSAAADAIDNAKRVEQNAAELKGIVDGLHKQRAERVEELAQLGRDIEAAAAHRSKVAAEFDATMKRRKVDAEAALAGEVKAARDTAAAEFVKLTSERERLAELAVTRQREVAALEARKALLEKDISSIRETIGNLKLS